jgi:hypothetical protein
LREFDLEVMSLRSIVKFLGFFNFKAGLSEARKLSSIVFTISFIHRVLITNCVAGNWERVASLPRFEKLHVKF